MKQVILALQFFSFLCIFTLLVAFAGCSGGGEDDTASTSTQATTVSDNDQCNVDAQAAADAALEEAEDATGDEAVGLEEIESEQTNNGGLDQSTALRTFRVYMQSRETGELYAKSVNVTVNGCENEIHITTNDNDTSSSTTVNAQAQQG